MVNIKQACAAESDKGPTVRRRLIPAKIIFVGENGWEARIEK
jgi:hypothetical protein